MHKDRRPTIALHQQVSPEGRLDFGGGQAALDLVSAGDGVPCETSLTLRQRAESEWRVMAALLAGDRRMRISPDGGRTFPAWWDGGGRRRREVPLSLRLPNEPVTVPVFHAASGTGRMLALDFDVSRAALRAGVADPVAHVAAQAAGCGALLERCGFSPIADRSPTGGRHLYVLIAEALPWTELRDTVRALQRRYPAIDASPMMSVGGQIRVPGSGHKLRDGRLTGWMALTMPLADAARAARAPAGAGAWNALQVELTAEYAELGLGALATTAVAVRAGVDARLDELADLPRDDDGMPWLPRIGGALPAAPRYADIATSGTHDLPSGSEAAWAVLWSCARRGWRLADIRARIESGEWAGLWELYGHRRRAAAARTRALEADWQRALRKILAQTRMEKSGRRSDTSPNTSRAPLPEEASFEVLLAPTSAMGGTGHEPVQCKDGSLNEWQQILLFQNAVWAAERSSAERALWGRQAISIRRVLRALMVAARLSGSTTTGFGIRHLALIAKMSDKTVAKVLRRLRDEPDPWVDHVVVHHWDQPDRYMLRLPDRHREIAVWRRWRAGLIPAIHPVFRHLAAPCAFVYEALDDQPTLPGQIATTAALSSSAVTDALRELAAHGLAVRAPARGGDPGGWTTGPLTLDAAGLALGADETEAAIRSHYQAERLEFRRQLAGFHASYDGIPGDDPDPGSAAERADQLACQDPPEEHPGPADHLPDHIPSDDAQEPAPTEPDPPARNAPPHQAATRAFTEPRRTHPLAEQLRTRGPGTPRIPRQRSAPPPLPPLVPMPAAEQARLAAQDPILRLLSDELGAVVLTRPPPP